MNCTACNTDSINRKKAYWSTWRSPVKCDSCGEKLYVKRFWSNSYWVTQGSGIFLAIVIMGGLYGGLWGLAWGFLSIIAFGYLIHFLEYKYSGLELLSDEVLERKTKQSKLGNYIIVGFFLMAIIGLLLEYL